MDTTCVANIYIYMGSGERVRGLCQAAHDCFNTIHILFFTNTIHDIPGYITIP